MPTLPRREFLAASAAAILPTTLRAAESPFRITEDAERIRIEGDAIDAAIRKTGYVSGVEARSLHDKKSGFRDIGFGLDIVDWLMEPGSDEEYRAQLPGDLPYEFNNLVHGKRAKRSIEGPQICTQAKKLSPKVIHGKDFVAISQDYRYTLAAPGKKTGSLWEQTIVFPAGKRYFVSADRITSANDSENLFFRLDMPGHIKHTMGDSFSEVYLSYHGTIPARDFFTNFAPDDKFLYIRDDKKTPKRFIRGYHIRDPKTGKDGPWLAGMTLDPTIPCEAWCHQRGYVCMIQENGGHPVKVGDHFGAAYIVGFFDSVAEMEKVYDEHAGHAGLTASTEGWKLTRKA